MIYDPLGEAPPLHADGVCDDTAALQWYVDHSRTIPSGSFKINSPIIYLGHDQHGLVIFTPALKLSVLAIYSAYGIEFGPIRRLNFS